MEFYVLSMKIFMNELIGMNQLGKPKNVDSYGIFDNIDKLMNWKLSSSYQEICRK